MKEKHFEAKLAKSLRRAMTGLYPLFCWALAFMGVDPAIAAGSTKSEVRDSPFMGQSQIAVSILKSSRPIGVFQVDVGILVVNPAQRMRAQGLQPVLRDAWRGTTQEFANSYLVPGEVPDANLLGARLQTATDRILGVGSARVLFTSVIVR
jgi:hypothetical protein